MSRVDKQYLINSVHTIRNTISLFLVYTDNLCIEEKKHSSFIQTMQVCKEKVNRANMIDISMKKLQP